MTDATTPEGSTGYEVIQSYLKTSDGSPGVYRMLDRESRVLYVGKARNLRARVSNLCRAHGPFAADCADDLDDQLDDVPHDATETEALLLEQNLIKQLKPKFNVLLRDDKSFPNILVTPTRLSRRSKSIAGAKKEKGATTAPLPVRAPSTARSTSCSGSFCCATAPMRCLRAARALPAISDQALLGPLCREDHARRLSPTVEDARTFLSGEKRRHPEPLAAEMARPPRNGVRARRRLA